MGVLRLVSTVAVGILLATPKVAEASPITIDVATVTWTVIGDTCTLLTPEDCQSVFTLQYLWLLNLTDPAPGPAPATIDGSVSVPVLGSTPFDPVDAAVFPSTSIFLPGVPTSANATVTFSFLGPRTIGPTDLLNGALFDNGFPSELGIAQLYQFNYDDSPVPVPEPSTLSLLALGLLALRRRRARN